MSRNVRQHRSKTKHTSPEIQAQKTLFSVIPQPNAFQARSLDRESKQAIVQWHDEAVPDESRRQTLRRRDRLVQRLVATITAWYAINCQTAESYDAALWKEVGPAVAQLMPPGADPGDDLQMIANRIERWRGCWSGPDSIRTTGSPNGPQADPSATTPQGGTMVDAKPYRDGKGERELIQAGTDPVHECSGETPGERELLERSGGADDVPESRGDEAPSGVGVDADDREDAERARVRSTWIDQMFAQRTDWTSIRDIAMGAKLSYNTIRRYRSGAVSLQDRYVRRSLAKAFRCGFEEVPE